MVIPVLIVTPPETEEVVKQVTPVPCPKVAEVKPVQEVERATLVAKAPASAAPVPQVPVVPAAKPLVDQSEPVVRDPAAPRFSSDYKFLDYSKEDSIQEKNVNKPSSNVKPVEKKKTVVSGNKSLKFIHFSNKIAA